MLINIIVMWDQKVHSLEQIKWQLTKGNLINQTESKSGSTILHYTCYLIWFLTAKCIVYT